VSQNETKAATTTTTQKSTHKLEMAHFCNLVKRPIKRSQNAGTDVYIKLVPYFRVLVLTT